MDKRVIKYFSGEMDIDERIAFMREMDSEESLKKDFLEYKNTISLLSIREKPRDREEGESAYTDFSEGIKNRKRKLILLNFIRYAAIVIFVFALSWLIQRVYLKENNQQLVYNTVSVPAGQRASLRLSDGTKVWLNSRSVFSYPSNFSQKERKVKLEGEAYFEVSKNKKKPFIVSARSFDVKVLGTVFNLSTYKEFEESSVSLVEGRVEVEFDGRSKTDYILSPNHTLNYKKGKVQISVFDTNDSFIWKDGIYSFSNVSLSEIMKKMSVYYNVKIVIANPKLSASVYTGKFRQNSSVDEILSIIRRIQKFNLDKRGNTYILK